MSRSNIIILACFLTFALRAWYVFDCTDYRHYLVSDMAGYWTRASWPGTVDDRQQWCVWPPFGNGLLGVARFIAFAIRPADPLPIVLLFGLAAGASGIWPVYHLTRRLTFGGDALSAIAALAYALWPQLVLEQSCILSENVAVPALAWGVWLSVLPARHVPARLLAGLLLACAVAMRPMLGPALLAYALTQAIFLIRRQEARLRFPLPNIDLLRRLSASAPLVATVICLLVIVAYNFALSRGNLIGLSANGGLNWYMQQNAIGHVKLHSPSGTDPIAYEFWGPTHSEKFQDLTVAVDDQHWFYSHAPLTPASLARGVVDLTDLYASPLFPFFTTMRWIAALSPLSSAMAVLVSLSALVRVVFPASRPVLQRSFTAMFAAFIIVCVFYGSDRRFLMPLLPALIPVAIATCRLPPPGIRNARR